MKKQENLSIAEHVSGVWSYHLVRENKFVALCGRDGMMSTALPLDQWGSTSGNEGIRYKWCKGCAQVAGMDRL